MRTGWMILGAVALSGCVMVNADEAVVSYGVSQTEARAIVEARNQIFAEVFLADDAVGLAELYTLDGRVMPPDGPDVVGRSGLADFWAGAMAVLGEVRLYTDSALPAGDYIIERGHVELYDTDGNLAGTGKAVVVYEEEDGTWKIKTDIWNDGPL